MESRRLQYHYEVHSDNNLSNLMLFWKAPVGGPDADWNGPENGHRMEK